MTFRPSFLSSVAVAVALVILVNLGLWQLRRHVESGSRVELVDARRRAPPATVADLALPPHELAWRDARLVGHFVAGEPFLVAGRFEDGDHGYDLIERFQVDGGPVLLVNRGYVPAKFWETEGASLHVEGSTTVEGLLLPIEGPVDLQPLPASSGHPERWPRETSSFLGCASQVGPPFASIAVAAGSPVAPVYLTVGPELEEGRPAPKSPWPRGGYYATPKQIGHLEYAIQWFLIAGTLVAIWAGSAIRRGKGTG
jgi:surfeit locus 1 family protein